MLISKDCFLTLLKLDDGGEDESLECSEIETESQYSGTTFRPHHRLGRQPLWVKFPTLIDDATRFVKEHSCTAHNRRRESTGIGRGVSWKDIQEHLLEYVTGLREHGISRDTVHHLTVAPRKKSTRAERYKGYVNARVPSKRNNYGE